MNGTDEKDITEDSTTAHDIAPAENFASTENYPSDLLSPMWSVVTYESVAASNLSYDEASELAKKLKQEKMSGLCIVTDHVAQKL